MTVARPCFPAAVAAGKAAGASAASPKTYRDAGGSLPGCPQPQPLSRPKWSNYMQATALKPLLSAWPFSPCCSTRAPPAAPASLSADEAEATKPTQQQSGLEADFADGFKRE
jgi:hypothetical protein